MSGSKSRRFSALLAASLLPAPAFAAPAPDAGAGYAQDPATLAGQRRELREVLGREARTWPSPVHDDGIQSLLLLDRVEWVHTGAGRMFYLEGQGWIGDDLNKLWVKGEGAHRRGRTEDANFEAYYSRAVAPYWDAQLGLRHDFPADGGPARNWLGIGVQGLAPYKFDTEVTFYVGPAGRTAARLRAEYDLYVTQRLVFWPELELNAYGKDDPERGIGAGLANSAATVRLRYEIRREFAPYLGVQWVRKYAGTADYARRAGALVSDTQYLLGFRAWW